MDGSDEYERAICVMYDLGGYNPDRYQKVLNDAKNIYDTYATTRKFYLHENGKPLLALWGVGFNPTERNYTNSDIQQLVDALQEMGYSIMLGVTSHWRTGDGDTYGADLRNLHNLIRDVDVIMPWYVGRYGSRADYATFKTRIDGDIKWCEDPEQGGGVGYAPLCLPGSSDRNMHPNNGVISRERGAFLWDQVYSCVNYGAQSLYIAMFDEVDEGTAIYKCLNASDVPDNTAPFDYWVIFNGGNYTMSNYEVTGLEGNNWCRQAKDLNVIFQGIEDGLGTDHYLWLVGQAREMLRGNIPLSKDQPARP